MTADNSEYLQMIERNLFAIKQSIDKVIGINKRRFENDNVVGALCTEIWADCLLIEERLEKKVIATK